MEFCGECGSIMLLKGDGKKKYLACARCKFKKKEVTEFKLSEEVKVNDDSEVEVVEGNVETHPKVKKNCSKCKSTEAYFWAIQTRAGDEPETEFYKCVECKHQWRENN